MTRPEEIARNLDAVRERLRAAETAAGVVPGSVRLVAVSKTMPATDISAAMAAGQREFGENYAQELRDKRAAFAATATVPSWHFIGPLQSNKVKYVAGRVTLLHTIDTADLLDECARRAAGITEGAELPLQVCLVQVNLVGEQQKRGVAPEALPALLDRFAAHPGLRCAGLMLIPPVTADPEAARPHFAALRRLRDQEARIARGNVDLRELSMGMSHDLEVAVAEGATLVRIGTAIFGERRPA